MRRSKRRDCVDEETQSDQQLRRDNVADLYERAAVENEEKEIEKSEGGVEEHQGTVRFGEENAVLALHIA